MSDNNPIAIFDSGLGGLSIYMPIRQALPDENLLYVADTAHLPYGNKPVDYVKARALAIGEFFTINDAKAIVVACNTATAAAIDKLRERFHVPVIGIEPAVKPASLATKSGVVGVLATEGTLKSGKFSELVSQFGQDTMVLVQPCEGWVECVERGDLDSEQAEALVRRHVEPLLARGADYLVLGCTHYPFLASLIRRVIGDDVELIDPGQAVVRQLLAKLDEYGLRTDVKQKGEDTFYSTGSALEAMKVTQHLLGRQVVIKRLPSVFSSGAGLFGRRHVLGT